MKRKVLPCFMALSMTLTAVPNVAMAEDGSMNEAETVVETTVETEPAKESAGEVGAPEVVDTTEETKEETTEETVVEAVEIQPAMVMATEEVTAKNAVVKVATADGLKSAVEQAADSGVETTIQLTENIVDFETEDIIEIPAGTKIILDMNNKIISTTSDFYGRPIVNYGTLTVKGNGTIDSSNAESKKNGTIGMGAIDNFGTLLIENGTYKGSVFGGAAIRNKEGASLTIEDGYFESNSAVYNFEGATAVINGGEFHSEACNAIKDDVGNDSYYAYAFISAGDLYFNDGKVTGVQGALAINNGYAEVKNGTFETVTCEHGNDTAFYALYIAGERGVVDATISGGTFKSATRVAVSVGNDNTGGDGGLNLPANATITGGTFIGGGSGAAALEAPKTGTLNITGGTFSSNVEEFVDPSSNIEEDGKGNWVTKPIPIEDAVASVGEKNYKTLAAAVKNAAAGDTVKLIKPVELTETLTIDKEIDLDLNKNTITIKDSVAEDGILISTSEDADVVIYNGTITDERGKDKSVIGKNTIDIKGQANVTTKDLTVGAYAPKDQSSPYYNYLLRIQPDDSQNVGSLTLDAGTKIQELSNGSGETYGVVGITAMGAYDDGNNVPENYEGVKVVIKDGASVETTGYALSGNGSKHGTTFIIEGGNLYSKESTAIYHPQMGTMTISGDNTVIKGGNTGIEVRAGNVTIKDGVVEGLATPTEVDGNGNGTTSAGAGIAIAQHTTKLPINVTITGGEIKGYSAFYESNPQKNPENDLNKINISIVDGTFTATNGGTTPIYSEDKQNFITGGTYSNALLNNNYLGDNYQLTPNEDGTFGVDYNKDGAVAKAGEVYCKTLKEAGERVKDGETISILKNIDDASDFMKIDGKKNVTIDLNGYTVKGSGYDGVINAVNGATVTIDGRDANSAIIANEDRGYAMAVWAYGQGTKVTINGGSYTQNITGTDNQYDMIYASDKATIEILNGYFKSATPRWTLNLKDNDGATMLVKGGSFVDYDPSNSQSENPPADFVADGYKVSENNGVYTVSKKSSGGSHRYDGYITIINPKNGTVSVSDDWADEDQKITLTITPDKGYVVDKIEIVDAEGDKIDAKKVEDEDNEYTFRMANCDVTVTVTFKEEGKTTTEDKEETEEADKTEETTTPETVAFSDVSESDWFYKGVSYVVENGMMNGVGDDQFAPNAPLTREMLAVVLYNMEKQPESTGVNPFADVKADMWYTDAIVWANANGIVAGYDDSTFGLGDSITREQLAAILYRYAQMKGYDVTEKADLTGYADSTAISGYAVEAMQWANANGIVNGMTETTLAPQGTATRAQVATMLMNFCENVAAKAE